MMRWLSSGLWEVVPVLLLHVVYTVDVFGVEVKHFGQIIDRGYEVGGVG